MSQPQTSRIRPFILEYLKDRNATQAAIRVGYSARSAKQVASRMLLRPEVQAILADEEAKLREQMGVTVESVAKELEAARLLAEQVGQPGAMVAASMGKAKLYGLIIDKSQNENRNVNADELPDAELARIATGGSGRVATAPGGEEEPSSVH